MRRDKDLHHWHITEELVEIHEMCLFPFHATDMIIIITTIITDPDKNYA